MHSSTRPTACQTLLCATPCPPPRILLPPGNLAPGECWASAPPCPVKLVRCVCVTMPHAVCEVQELCLHPAPATHTLVKELRWGMLCRPTHSSEAAHGNGRQGSLTSHAPAPEAPSRHAWPSLPSSSSMWGFQGGNTPPAQQAWPQQQQQQQNGLPLWLQKLQKPVPQQEPAQQQQQPEAVQLPSALPAFGSGPWLQQGSRGVTLPGSMDQPLRPQPAGINPDC